MFVLAALYRLALAFWVGGVALFTFALTPTLFATRPRDFAGEVVGILFPPYFYWGLACGALALLCVLLLRGRYFIPAALLLTLMLAATGYQSLVIEPQAAALKEEIGSFEATSRDHPLRREFSRLHGISAACNLAVFVGGVLLIALQPGERRKGRENR